MRLLSSVLLFVNLSGAAHAQTATQTPQHGPSTHADVVPPRVRHVVPPVYPEAARAQALTGTVVMRARVAKDGSVHDIAVLSGPAELTQAAQDAAAQWQYAPATLNGIATEAMTTIRVNFGPSAPHR